MKDNQDQLPVFFHPKENNDTTSYVPQKAYDVDPEGLLYDHPTRSSSKGPQLRIPHFRAYSAFAFLLSPPKKPQVWRK